MDYTEDKTDDENEEYPRSDAASANKKLCPTLVKLLNTFLNYTEEEATANVSI